jgi:hypothetical protein
MRSNLSFNSIVSFDALKPIDVETRRLIDKKSVIKFWK